MRKTILICLMVVMLLACLTGCSSGQSTSDHKISVVASIFPAYDWAKEIIGNSDGIELTLLLDGSTDMHSFQPTVADIIKISECDIFIYVGGESDAWAEAALEEAVNEDMLVINLMEVLGDTVKEEEFVEGMEAEEEGSAGIEDNEAAEEKEDAAGIEDNEAAEAENEGANVCEEAEYDEHVWLSVRNAIKCSQAIAQALIEKDAANAAIYESNCNDYIKNLEELDAEFCEIFEAGENNCILFGDRFPFRYFTEDYELDYYAAFAGCSAESEASFETVIFLAGKLDELNLSTIFVLENSDQSLAETIRDNTKNKDQKILVLNSMQSVTGEDIANGASYISIMRENMEVLGEAAGGQ